MCRPISVIKKSFVTQMQYTTRFQPVTTTLARKSAGPVHSDEMVTCELVIMWNGRRRTMFIDAMVWDEIPDDENLDLVVSMTDALDTGMIAFALPHEWRRSWLGTAAFSNNLPLALRNDLSLVASAHAEFVMKPEDEDLIDITERIALTSAHIITDVTSLTAAQRYWLELFPKLNTAIPKEAHPDLPKFNPPFDEAAMKTYQDKNPSKVPRASPKLQDKISETFSKLAEASIINKHANPVGVASYVVLVTKPDGSLRICINFCKVNKMLYTHHHPLPCCSDMLNQIARKKFYSKVDLHNGFYNFDMHEDAKWLTSTIAPGHALTWNKIPQGLAPVPSWFQWAMQMLLSEYIDAGACLVYIDDLIIMGDSPEELQANIKLVLARLDKYDMRISIKKCDFELTTEIEFLGHKISQGKISPGPKSSSILQGIVNPNHERDAKDKNAKLNTLIGIINWFSKYIPDCNRQLLPLLNARNDGWTWGTSQEQAFLHFKSLLSDLQPLHLPTGGSNRLEIHTDASKDGWFAVLFEDTGEGAPQDRLKVIAYAGGVFRGPQLSWSILQKEMYAVYNAHLKFDCFVRLHEFKLVIDNKTMCYCETSADPMVQRWYLRIQHYQSEIIHLPGILNVLPDAGSRLLHLEHPNLETSQFCSITSALFCSLGSALCSRQLNTASKRNQSNLLAALLTHRQVASAHADVCGCAGDLDADDMTIRALQTHYSRSGHSDSDSASFTTPTSSQHGPASCSTQVLETHSHITSEDWATRPMPRGPSSRSTVPLDDDADLDAWMHQEFPDAASTQVLADDASFSSSACARLAAEPSAAQRATAITPEHVHFIRTCDPGSSAEPRCQYQF